MAAFKTLQFLPEIFRTDSNRKFLNATVDQLVSEPNLIKVNGYIGRKLAPSYKTSDSYITEPTKSRQDYQLEPGVVNLEPDTNKINNVITYPGINDAIGFQGGINLGQHFRCLALDVLGKVISGQPRQEDEIVIFD